MRISALLTTLTVVLIIAGAMPAQAADADTTIDSGPSGTVTTSSATFAFSGSDGSGGPATSFECRLDAATWAACTSPYITSLLPDAPHTFRVRALDTLGVPDPTPAQTSWAVDVTGPDTVIDTGPPAATTDTSATFGFSGSDALSVSATWGEQGSAPGQFAQPYSIALDSAGNVYVAEAANNRIQEFDATGVFLGSWGSLGTGTGQFNAPYGIAVDASDNVYVTDGANNRVQKFDSGGAFLTSWGTPGTGDGQFNSPRGITVGPAGNVYVADGYNHRIQKFDSGGTFLAKWGSKGTGNGQFNYPFGIAVGNGGSVYVTDYNNSRIQKFDSSGAFLAKWGTYGTGIGQLRYPYGVSTDASGTVYVADTYNYRVQTFDENGTYLTKFGSRGSTTGQFNLPYATAVASSGDVFVADLSNNRLDKFTTRPASFQCRLDGGAWSPCTSTKTYTGLASGPHTFEVASVDSAGIADASPSSWNWTVSGGADITAPAAAPTQAPAANGAGWNKTDVTVTWNWTDSESGIDVGNCTTSSTSSTEGDPVTLSASCKDLAGNTGSASYNLKVDKTNPDTSITGGPTSPTTSNSASFDFSGSDVGGSGVASFECQIDGGGFAPCTSPQAYGSLTEGSHTFDVRAIDAADNTDGSPASQTWVVDSVAPDTTITSGPTSPVTGVGTASVTFDFSGTDAAPSSGGPTFECDLDGAGWAPCSPPLTVSGLANGSHTWQVRAVDGAGNVDGSPASQTFTVAICTVTGTAGNDTLTGTAGVNVICGLGGNDTLAGLGGADILSGGPGIDTLDYSASAAGVSVDLTTLTASGGDAAGDTIIGGVDASENITGSNSADSLTGDANANVLIAIAGIDTLSGLGGDDTLTGGTGGDTLLPGDGQVTGTITGGANAGSTGVVVPGPPNNGPNCLGGCTAAGGTDMVSYANISGATGVTVNLATGALGGATSGTILTVESVTGSPNADTLKLGASGNAYGLAGNDTLTGAKNANAFLDGGTGTNNLAAGGGSSRDVCFNNNGGGNTCKFTVYP